MILTDLLIVLDKNNIQYTFAGEPETSIEGYSSIYNYKQGTVSWLRKIETFQSPEFQMPEVFSCIITKEGTPRIENARSQIWVSDPKDAFLLL